MTMKPFEIQSPSLSINGVLIDTSVQGNLVLPGVTRASTSVAIEVEDTRDQTYNWGQGTDPNTITVVDGYTYSVNVIQQISGQPGWTPATYAIDEIDDEGYIDGISVVDGGAGYTGEAVTYSTEMFATADGSTWQEIPFKVRCGAGEIESVFGGGGGGATALDQLNDVDISDPQDGEVLVWNSNDEVWKNQTVSGGGPNPNYKGFIIASGGGPYDMNNQEAGYVVQLLDSDVILPNDTLSGATVIFTNQGGQDRTVFVGAHGGAIYHGQFFDNNSIIVQNGETMQVVSRGDDGGTEWDIVGGSIVNRLTSTSTVTGLGTFSTLPDFLDFEPNTQLHAGQNSNGVFFSGNAGSNTVSYPIRTNFSINSQNKTVVTVDMVVNDTSADFGMCVFLDGTQPEWKWGTNNTRIAVQYDGTDPVIEGFENEVYANNGSLPGTGTYTVRFTYDPNNNPFILFETLDNTGTVIASAELNETVPNTGEYRIGFGADQDSGNLRTYIKNLIIEITDSSGQLVDRFNDPLLLSSGSGSSLTVSDGAGTTISNVTELLLGGNITDLGGGAVAVSVLPNAGVGVLTSDSEGNFSWVPASTGAHGGGTPPTLVTSATESGSNDTVATVNGFVATALSVIVVASGVETSNGTHSSIVSIEGMGLRWIRRAKYSDPTTGSTQQSEIWYAVNTTDSDITGDITITFDNQFDDQSTIVSNYLGCDLNNPWTSSGPSYSNNINGDGYPTVTMNANEVGTLGFAFFATPTSQNDFGPGYVSGWTNVELVANNGAEFWEYVTLSTQEFTSPQSNLTLVADQVVDPMGNNDSVGMTLIADALVSAGTGGSGATDRITNGEFSAVLGSDGNLTLPAGKNIKAQADNEGVYSVSIDPNGIDFVWSGQDTFSINKGPGGGSINTETGKSFYISTNGGQNSWELTTRGGLAFPDGTIQTTAFVNRNVNLDGGGSSVHYDADVAFIDGGFSATRHGVIDPTFDGGNTLTENNQINLDGGGA